MVSSVILMMCFSIALVQCLHLSNKAAPLQLNKILNTNFKNAKSFVESFESDFKYNVSNYEQKLYEFGERKAGKLRKLLKFGLSNEKPFSTDDELVGYFYEQNFFDSKESVELDVGYPNVEVGKFQVNYVKVVLDQVKLLSRNGYLFSPFFVKCLILYEKLHVCKKWVKFAAYFNLNCLQN